MNAAEQLILLGGVSSASGSDPGSLVPANALYDDDGVTALLDDDGTTFLTSD